VDYGAGDVIWYRTFGGGLRRVLVEERLADVKHGRPGFVGTVVSGPETGMGVWGYDDQIVPLRAATIEGCAAEHAASSAASSPRGGHGPARSTTGRRPAGRMSRWA
jgi:hypothetical protein